MKKIVAILISILLVLTLGAGVCAALAVSEPEEDVFADQMGEKPLDLSDLLGNLFSGSICLPYDAVNRTICNKLAEKENPSIAGLLLAPSETDHTLWMRVWLCHENRTWVVTVRMRVQALTGQKGVTGLALTPEEIRLGKLPVPEMLWPTLLRKLADRAELAYKDGRVIYDLPDLDLKLVKVKDIRAENKGFVLEVGMGSLWD